MSYGQGFSRSQTHQRQGVGATFSSSRHDDSSTLPTTLPAALDLSAPVIHFGTNNPIPRERMRQTVEFVPSQTLLAPPSRQQKMHSLFVGGCPALILDDYWMERILKAAGKLRVWKRVTDALGQGQAFGFAEYDDPEHVMRAYTILQDLAIKLSPAHESKMLQLKVTIDEGGAMYIRDFHEARTIKDPETKDAASLKQHTAQVQQVLRDLASPKFKKPEKYLKDKEKPQSKAKQPEIVPPAVNEANAVTIMLSMDDELGDIPEEQRRYIADEITGFRTRSAKRDADRQSKIADAESRRAEFEKAARGSNGLALQQQARQLRRVEDAQDASLVLRPKRDLHTDAERGMTDAEIHASRERAAELALAPRIAEEERRLVHRERQRLERLEQETLRLQGDARRAEEDRLHAARKYAVYEDAKEDARGLDTYFSDFDAWRRHRLAYRQRELQADAEDRMAEEREVMEAGKVQSAARQQASVAEAQPQMEAAAPVRLTIAKQARKTAAPSGTLLGTEDDEEEDTSARKRKLVPMQFEAEDDRVARLKRIVDAIPVDKEALWTYNVPWQHLEQNGLQDKLKSFVAKKCVEAIGVEAEELIDFVMEHVGSHGSAADLEQEMMSAIGDEDEAAAFTVKCWRYLLILLETATL